MEIIIKKEVLISALQLINAVTDKSSVKPILSNFLLKTLDDSRGLDGKACVEFSATDYELSIIGKFPAQVIEPGSLCVSARKVYDICREFPGEDIHIKSNEQLWIHITCGSSKLKLPSVEVGLYPQTSLEELNEKIKTTPSDVKRFIDMTLFAAQTNESRRNLMGVCLSLINQNTTRWLATDGHRLAQVMGVVEETASKGGAEVIIPRKALAEVSKSFNMFDGPLEISFDEHHLQFMSRNISIKTRLIEGKFPNCDPIIPKDNNLVVILDRDRLINSLKMVSLISTDKLKPVKLTMMAGRVTLESEKAEYGEVNDELIADYQGNDFQIGFNAKYLLDVLHVINGTQVQFDLKNPMSPCLVKDPGNPAFLSVIMPLRIEW